MQRTRVLAGTALLGLAVAACGGSSGTSDTSSSSAPAPSGAASGSTSTGTSTTGYQKEHAGGTLHLLAKSAAGSLDPQVNYTLQYWQLYQSMYDGLLAFHKVDGPESFKVVPDLAEAMPKVSNGGKTYTFKLRPNIKFSNGKTVTTDDVVASFERIFTVSSPTAGTFYNGIVGADACLKTPAGCKLPKGVVGNAKTNTVTINLTNPDPELPYKLAVPHATILPKGSPPKDAGTTPLPTTGAYKVASYDPNRALKLVRNTNFKEWSAEAQPQGYPDEIDETFGLTVESEITAVENGQADWVADPPPADRLNEIGTKYADQAHVNTLTAMWYLPMNVNIPPFNNVKARQAVNWALDRNAAVRLYGGPNLASPACTFLPPGFPGHVDFCDYTKGGGSTWKAPDIDKAKQLVQESGTKGQKVGVVVQDDEVNKAVGEYVQSTLNQIGYKATVKPISSNIQFTYIQNTKNKVQISLSSWYQDYPAASDFINVLLSCASFHEGSDSSINIAGFCDKKIDAQMQHALSTERTSMDKANQEWGQIDQAISKQAPTAPLFTPKLIDFTSKRVGNYQFSKQFYMLVGQLWVK
jgi:peptide/nickel transport system substrate-binding protein